MAEQRRADDGTHEQGGVKKRLKRRGILAAAGAVVAGIVAKHAAEPATANDGVWQWPYRGTVSTASGGSAMDITNNGTNSDGISVRATRDGIVSHGDVVGVLGSTGFTGIGVIGDGGSAYGAGVKGIGHGATTDEAGSGVYGTNTYGPYSVGVLGNAAAGYGVYGKAGDRGYGVTGVATNAIGVLGVSGSGVGVQGQINPGGAAANTYAVYGANYASSGNGSGVYGVTNTGNGVVGVTTGTGVLAGVYGRSDSAYGVIGSTTAAGYSGLTAITGTTGVAALAATSTNANAYAAYFQGTTVVQGNFVAFGGNKSAAVKDASGQHRLVYCVESPEAWFEDFGESRLVNGRAEVRLDPLFSQIVHTDQYHVFLTERDGHYHLAAMKVTPAGFTVEADAEMAALKGKKATDLVGMFSWRVVARRKDIARERLAKFTPPKIKAPDPAQLPRPPLPAAPTKP